MNPRYLEGRCREVDEEAVVTIDSPELCRADDSARQVLVLELHCSSSFLVSWFPYCSFWRGPRDGGGQLVSALLAALAASTEELTRIAA